MLTISVVAAFCLVVRRGKRRDRPEVADVEDVVSRRMTGVDRAECLGLDKANQDGQRQPND